MLPINICPICGEVIPETRHICEKCEIAHYEAKRRRWEKLRDILDKEDDNED